MHHNNQFTGRWNPALRRAAAHLAGNIGQGEMLAIPVMQKFVNARRPIDLPPFRLSGAGALTGAPGSSGSRGPHAETHA